MHFAFISKVVFMEKLADRIIEELVAIGFARATDYLYTKDGVLTVKDTEQLPEDAGAAIASIERSTTGLKVKFYDKLKALEMLGKCVGLFDAAQPEQEENNLLQTVLESTKEEMALFDIPEIQSSAADGNDLVEQNRS